MTALKAGEAASSTNESSPPHVLLVVDQLPKMLGGGERIALRIAALLPAYGYRVSLLTFDFHPDTSALASAACPVYLLPLTRTYGWDAFKGGRELSQFLRRERIQIVQTFFESSDLWAGMVTKVASNAKLVWSRRDMGILRSRKHRIAYRLMARMPDAVFAVSEEVRRHCIAVDGIDPERVQTVYNGLDPTRWIPSTSRRLPARDTVVTTVGNVRYVKGHDVFLRAAGLVLKKYPNVSFSIAGGILEPEYFSELQVLTAELGIQDRVHFCGPVSHLREHLTTADIFVLPSRSEGFSNAIIEAMAASLPVIATDVGGNCEAVEHGVSGLIVSPQNEMALAEAIMRLVADPAMARAMGHRGKAIADSKFTEDAMMNRITSGYKKLIAR